MELSCCLLEKKEYVSFNEIRKWKKFLFFRKMKILENLEDLGYSGEILRVSYCNAKKDSFYIPDRPIETSTKSITLVEKDLIEEILQNKFDIDTEKIVYISKTLKTSNPIKSFVNKIDFIPHEIEFDDSELAGLDKIYHKIKLYGKRNPREIFFSLADLSNTFELPNLSRIILDRKGSYKYKLHYASFYANEEKTETVTLLTLSGALKIVFGNKNINIGVEYSNWIFDVVFYPKSENIQNKEETLSISLNIPLQRLKNIFVPLANIYSCIYLVKLGTKKELNGIFNLVEYNDNSCVYKFGYTGDILTRMNQHRLKYGKMGITNLKLSTLGFIDDVNLSNAETEIKKLFGAHDLKLEYPGEKELVVIANSKIGHYISVYKQITEIYAGKNKQLSQIIIDKNNKIINLEITIKSYEKCQVTLENMISLQNNTITTQNEKIFEQKDTITEQQTKISEQQEKITEQKEKITEQKEKISEQKEYITEQKEIIFKQKEKISEQKEKIFEQKETIAEQKNTIALLTKRLNKLE